MAAADQHAQYEDLNTKIETLEKRVLRVIEKLHGYVKDNCVKASVREKCENLQFEAGSEGKEK